MIKTKIAQIAISVFMIILVISSYFLIRDFWEHKKSNDSSIELIENVITEEKTEKDIEILERIILEITEIKHTDIPPICENSKLCKKCAYFDLCII